MSTYTDDFIHAAKVVSVPGRGYAGRFEVRQGDFAIGGPRSEVGANHNGVPGMVEGSVTWQAFSTMFDPTFPNTHSNALWTSTRQRASRTSPVRGR